MHTLSRIFAGALLLAAPAAFAQSATATASNVPASARIYVPITVSLTNGGMSFGDIFTGTASSDVTLDPQSNNRSATGDATLAGTGTARAAAFEVSGKRNATYAITLPTDGAVTLTGNGGTPMPLSKFTASVNNTAATGSATGQLPNSASAKETFTVGATLTVGANQTDGDYTGTFNVTVAYN
ncbi:DUF4402 domain-containing protein [Geothrix fuzhouensis]|uniref:DUF4402 domain-containing protein n=1 Tax=Geothrix fuzhouensis TaxID=2966451 RepID=UPI0021490AA5|nr:DUF4402 domain-containing protein [Geothrix fuzhouensis]